MKEETAKTYGPGFSQTFDAIPEDEERQEELNRLMKKPGEPGYRPPVKKTEPANTKSDDAQKTG